MLCRGVIVFDPLSYNPYRILGWTRDQDPANLSSAPPFQCPGLHPLDPSDEQLAWAREQLEQAAQRSFYQSCWFDARRPVDQLAYADVLAGQLHEAWHRWSQDDEPLSKHNLAVIAHLRWLFQPDQRDLMLDCCLRWKALYSESAEPGYQSLLNRWLDFNREQAQAALQEGDPQRLRACWSASALFQDKDSLESEQMALLKTEQQRWEMEQARLRKCLLDDQPASQVSQDFIEGGQPLIRFLLQALPEQSGLSDRLRQQLGGFFVSLARAWHRQASVQQPADPAGLDQAEVWQNHALELLTGKERQEALQELEHWKVSRQPREARAISVGEIVAPRPEPRVRLWVGLLVSVACLLALAWAVRQGGGPFAGGLTRPVAQQRSEQIVEEISPIAARLATIRDNLKDESGRAQRIELLQEQTRLKKRHEQLRTELERLQRWLQTHP